MLPSFYCPPDASIHLSPYLSIWTSRLVQTSSHYPLPGGENRYGARVQPVPASRANSRRPLTVAAARPSLDVLPVHYLSVIVARADFATASPSWCPIFTIRRANSEDGVYMTGCLEQASSDRLNRSALTFTAQCADTCGICCDRSGRHSNDNGPVYRHDPNYAIAFFLNWAKHRSAFVIQFILVTRYLSKSGITLIRFRFLEHWETLLGSFSVSK